MCLVLTKTLSLYIVISEGPLIRLLARLVSRHPVDNENLKKIVTLYSKLFT